MPVTVVSPVPGDFGQGFPGLVYASTRSYFQRGDRPLQNLSPGTQRFYADLLRPHEISHQWWGNVVYAPLDRDGWLMEALATYSSLLWLEENRGAKERDQVLAEFLRNLIRKSDGQSVDSAGPVVMGQALAHGQAAGGVPDHRLREGRMDHAHAAGRPGGRWIFRPAADVV